MDVAVGTYFFLYAFYSLFLPLLLLLLSSAEPVLSGFPRSAACCLPPKGGFLFMVLILYEVSLKKAHGETPKIR